MENRLEIQGINSKGFGTIAKLVMQDRRLSIQAKGLYSYFCSYSGAGDTCFPTHKKICYDLNISKDSLSKYLKELIKLGYISCYQVKDNGKFSHNVYTLNGKIPYPKITDTGDSGSEDSVSEELDSKNNNNKNNNNKNNNNNEKVYKPECITFITSEDTLGEQIYYSIYEEEIRELEQGYPHVDVLKELNGIRIWLINNPNKRKPRDEMIYYIHNCLKEKEERARS